MEGEQQQATLTATTAQGTRHFSQQDLAQENLDLRAEHLSCTFPLATRLSARGTKTRERSTAVQKKHF